MRVDRIALHGSEDHGDVGPIHVRGLKGVAEVKNYKGRPSPGQLAKWQRETLAEKGNGGWDFAYLLVHEPGCNLEDSESPTYEGNRVYMTLQDLATMAFGSTFEPANDHAERVYGTWVQLTVGSLANIMFD